MLLGTVSLQWHIHKPLHCTIYIAHTCDAQSLGCIVTLLLFHFGPRNPPITRQLLAKDSQKFRESIGECEGLFCGSLPKGPGLSVHAESGSCVHAVSVLDRLCTQILAAVLDQDETTT